MKLLLLFLFSALLWAAPPAPTTATLKARLESLHGPERLECLLALTDQLEGVAPLEALHYAVEGVRLARRDKDRLKEAIFLNSEAFCYTQTADLALGVQYGKASLALSMELGNPERIAKAHNSLGIAYTYLGLYSQALEEHLEALRIREEFSMETASLHSLNVIGVVYHHSGQYRKAIEYYEKIFSKLRVHPDDDRYVLTKLNLGFAQYRLGMLAEALKNIQEAIALADKTGNVKYRAYANYNLGLIQTSLGNFSQAKTRLQAAMKEYRQQDRKFGIVQVLNAMGRLSYMIHDFPSAIALGEEGVTLAKQIKSLDELKSNYELLSDAHGKLGHLQASFEYFRLFSETKDAISAVQESDKVADAAMKMVALKKDNDLASLQKEKVITSLRLAKVRSTQVILVSGVLFLAIIIGLLVRYNRHIQAHKLVLRKKNGELEQLNADLQEKVTLIRTLSGLLPICAQCKKIRNDEGYWEQLEGYISHHTEATFSHGICPSCADALYPEVMESIRGKRVPPSS